MNEKPIKEQLKEHAQRLYDLQRLFYDYSRQNRTLRGQELESIGDELRDIGAYINVYVQPHFDRLGKRKTIAKTLASKENGKKGGRPPKHITELKKELNALEKYLVENSVLVPIFQSDLKDIEQRNKPELLENAKKYNEIETQYYKELNEYKEKRNRGSE